MDNLKINLAGVLGQQFIVPIAKEGGRLTKSLYITVDVLDGFNRTEFVVEHVIKGVTQRYSFTDPASAVEKFNSITSTTYWPVV